MGYEIQEKKTTRKKRFRVWDNTSDGYWHKPLTKEELLDTLLWVSVERAIWDVTKRFQEGNPHNRPFKQVAKWNHVKKDDYEYPEGYFAKRLAEMSGAEVSVDIKTDEKGVKTITATVTPVPVYKGP